MSKARPKVAYGLDLSSGEKCLVSAVRRGGTVRFERVEAHMELGGAVAVGSLGVAESVLRWISTPLESPAKARQVLPSVLDVALPFALEQSVYGFPIVEKAPEGGVRALALAARDAAVEARLETYREAGWDPTRLDHEGVAMWERAQGEVASSEDARIVLYLGPGSGAILVGRGGRLLSAHGLPGPFDDPDARDDFLGKIHRILASDLKGVSRERIQWVWTGPGAEDDALIRSLEERLSQGESRTFGAVEKPAEFLARSLAARGLGEGAIDADFRRGRWVHPRVSRERRRRRLATALSCTVLAYLLWGLQGAWLGQLEKRKAALQDELVARAKAIAPDARFQPGQEVDTVRKALDGFAESREPFTRAFETPVYELVAALLQWGGENGIRFGVCRIDDRGVEISGVVEDWARCEALVAFLDQQGFSVGRPSRGPARGRPGFFFRVKGERRNHAG